MSECMTIADETVDQKDICLDIAPKDIVEIILEEALLSALIVTDKGCSRIGDSNITDEFRQQYDQLSTQKDFEQVEPSQAQPAANKDSNFNFRENSDRAASVPAKGNLEQIIDSFVKNEEKTKPVNESQEISEEVLADNELQIKNGQIHIEKNKTEKATSESARKEYFDKKDVIKDEKIEIEYFDKGQLNKIYVPLNLTKSQPDELKEGTSEEEGNASNENDSQEKAERPFKPYTTEDLRQTTLRVWENGNSSLVGIWDDGLTTQPEKVVKIMEELSSAQMFPDSFVDSNRPRAYAFNEEDVKKMTKEIEDINFNQGHASSENSVPDHRESQSHAEQKSANIEKYQNECNTPNHVTNNLENSQKHEMLSMEEDIGNQTFISPNITAANPEQQNLNDETCIKEKKSLNQFDLAVKTQSKSDMEDCMNTKNNELLRRDSVNLKKSLLFENTENDIKQEALKDPDLTPELGVKLIQEEPSSPIMKPRNVSEPVDILPNTNHQTQQGTLTWNGLTWESKEAVYALNSNSFLEEKHWERITVDYNPVTEGEEEKIESNDGENFLQEPYDVCKSNFEIIQNGENANLNAEKTNERLEETLILAEKNVENFEKLDEKVNGDEPGLLKKKLEDEHSMNEATADHTQTATDAQDSQKNLNSEDGLSNTKSRQEKSVTSQTSLIQAKDEWIPENEHSIGSEALVSGSQKFKLHSLKMYLNSNQEPAGQVSNDFNLTDSEEAFIDMSENIIQIINPQENSADEDSNEISFSLVAETSNIKSAFRKANFRSELSLKIKESSESEIPPKKAYSGMTTIGPLKNMDYDPKDLSAPEIDYGKMTRITSSRQLARDIGLLNSENTALSVKIIEEDDSDDDMSLNLEDEHTDRNSLVNRDIASLTKVQKVREVMSHQAKPEEDFEDEESLPRPRLDLKDVESMTDERYKFPDVSIPLLSFEIGDRNLEAEKELIEGVGLVISGLTNACFYEKEMEDNTETQTNTCENKKNSEENTNVFVVDTKNSKTKSLNEEEPSPMKTEKEETSEESGAESIEKMLERKDSQRENSDNLKSFTLGSVFRKASSKFLRKDSELCMRNSKSLPRDTNKITAAHSIRSILDDCQSSATNALKKSCSLLKNTESIFKSISQSVMTSDRSNGSNTTQKKLSPSESDVSTIERKFSGYFKKEEFTKAKNLIKSKVEKTFKISDKDRSPSREREISSDKEDVRLAIRNEENLRLDRIENFKKFLPKSPLVYKSQFVRSQINFQSPPEPEPDTNPSSEMQDMNGYPTEDNITTVPVKEKGELKEESQAQPVENYPQENLQWIIQKDNIQLPMIENIEPQQPDFIVMETIQGLPSSDLESPSSEKENLNVENSSKKAGTDSKKIEAKNSLQILTGSSHDLTSRFPDTDDEKTVTKTPSERKIKIKKKKFTARFRSFWCSAFGRAKTPEKKCDLS